jgi:hypothetical protein
LYKTSALEYPQGVVGVARPWYPYYVFQVGDGTLLIGKTSRTLDAERRWVKQQDYFCWTTRQCLSIERATPIYGSKEDAEDDLNPLEDSYSYRYSEQFKSGVGGSEEQFYLMTALPVLERDDEYWSFVRPEGTERGYQVCWLKWDGVNGDVVCRIRISRREFDDYVEGLRDLLSDWKNAAKRADAKRDLYDHGLAVAARTDVLGAAQATKIESRRTGIPSPWGYLERPITSPLQSDNVTNRVVDLLKLSLSDVWDIGEVAYFRNDQLP